jgi:PAS domain S-box-containing protein
MTRIGFSAASNAVRPLRDTDSGCTVHRMDDALIDAGDRHPQSAAAASSFLAGGGQMGDRIRAFDWATSTVGSPGQWPAGLRTALRIMLTTNHPVFIFWGESLTCFYNDAYARSLGPEMHPRILGMRGREAWDEIWTVIGPQINLVMAGQGATWHENQLIPITRFGHVDDVYWTYSYGPIHDDNAPNGVGGVLVLCTETTERVLEAARVRADADRWRALFEQSPGFICVLRGPQHRHEYCNQAYLELIGRRADLIGETVQSALPELVAQGYISLLDSVYTTGVAHSAVAAPVTLFGVSRLVDFVYQPLRGVTNEINGILVQGVDVTAREHAKAAELETASRLQLATDAARLGIHEYDVQSGEIKWDARVREIWGVPDGVAVTYDLFIEGIVDEDRAATQAAVDRALDPDGDGAYEATYRVRDRVGKERWVRATGRVEFDRRTPTRLVGTVQDVTKEKITEAELIAADRRKDVFLATLAHELRNPLAPIRNAAQILSVPGIGAERLSWAQKIIARQSAHMASLLDDLLDVARLTQGRIELKREMIEIRSVIDSAVETVRPQLDAKSHRLELHVQNHGALVFVDPVRLCQVFANLLGNAIKYMEPGGLICVAGEADSMHAVISIHDTGMGISGDALKDVFGMFQQSEAALERAEGGLGIGLALVRALVELHGGDVSARSEGAGRGSTFRVSLPLASPPTELARPTAETETSRSAGDDGVGNQKRVLIADDNHDAAESLALLLTMHGYDVFVATDGMQALDTVMSFEPDVVLLDIGMPRMNGYDVARELRARSKGPDLRLIALTGWGQSDDRQRAFDAGFDAHLTKPPDIESLLQELSK